MKVNPRLIIDSVNFVLIAPAMFLIGTGILYLAFRMQAANELLDMLMATSAGRILFSPVVVFGGPMLVLVLNVPRLCRIEMRSANHAVCFSLSLKKSVAALVSTGLASLLIGLLLAYAFVENLQIIHR